MRYLRTKRHRDLKRRKWQYAAVLVTIALGVFLYVSSYDAYQNLNNSYNETYDRLNFADMLVTGADPGFSDDVIGVEGVDIAEDRIQAEVPAKVNGGVLLGRFIGMPEDEQPSVNQVDVEEGEYLSPDDLNGILVETHMASHFELAVGDTIEMFDGTEWIDVSVRGIVISPEYIWPAESRQNIFPNPDQFGVMFAREGMLDHLPGDTLVGQTMVVYEDEAEVASVDARVSAAAGKANAADSQTQAQQPSHETLLLDVQGFEQMAYMFPALFLLAAGMATYMILTRLVFTERSQIGTLIANGLTRAEILRHYLMYGVELGLVGAAIGCVFGVPAGWAMAGLYTAELGIPDTSQSLYPMTPILGMVFGLVAGTLSAWIPARAAFRVSPAEAMRGEIPAEGGRMSLVERVLPFLSRIPVRWRMSIRGISRNRRRSLSTVVAVVLALTLILVSWGMIDTIISLLDKQFNEISTEDAAVIMSMPVSDSSVREVGNLDGVDGAERVVALGVTVKSVRDSYATQIQGFGPETRMHSFEGFDTVPDGGVVLGESLASILEISEGDYVVLDFPTLDTEFEAKVIAFVDEPLGTFAYANREWLTDSLGSADPPIGDSELRSPASSVIMTRFDAGADRQKVIGGIEDLDSVVVVSDSRMIYELVQQFMGLFYLIVGMMLVFGGILAFTLIFNMMSVNLAERSGEIATMRANGISRRSIAWLLVVENMLLTAIGIPIGLLVGYGMAALFMDSFSSDMFAFSLNMQPTTFVLSSLAVFAVALIALAPGIRAVGRIDIGKVVRERSQ